MEAEHNLVMSEDHFDSENGHNTAWLILNCCLCCFALQLLTCFHKLQLSIKVCCFGDECNREDNQCIGPCSAEKGQPTLEVRNRQDREFKNRI